MSNSSSASRSTGRSGRRGGVDHLEVIPFRPHQAWWVQGLLLLWRWLFEIAIAAFLITMMVKLHGAGMDARLAVVAVLVAVLLPFVVPGIGPRVRPLVWLMVTRHRLRAYFLQCRVFNRSGRLPWILFTIPTPVGERVWVGLVPGLSIHDFENDIEEIASACWARTARVERHRAIGSLVRIDVVRHDPLTGAGNVPSVHIPAPSRGQDNQPAYGTAEGGDRLDLPNRVIDLTTPLIGAGQDKPRGGKTGKTRTSPAAASGAELRAVTRGGEDVSDYV